MKTDSTKKTHKVIKVLLVVLFLLIVCLVAVFISQRQNVDALVKSVQYSEEDIQGQIDSSKDNVAKTLEDYDVGNLRDFTFEEEEMIRKGQITYEEAMNKIMEESGVADELEVAPGGNSSNQGSASSDGSSVSSGITVPDVKAKTDNPSAIIAEYYVKLNALKAQYLGSIGSLVDEAKAEYATNKSLSNLASKYLKRASALESEADSSVDSLLSELRGKLEFVNADTSIVDKMKSAYEQEKTLKKSYYLSLYSKKG